jgi:putative endonuclease
VDKLAWYELYCNPHDTIARGKQIKKWRRAWKLKVIEELNPAWKDLSDEEGF